MDPVSAMASRRSTLPGPSAAPSRRITRRCSFRRGAEAIQFRAIERSRIMSAPPSIGSINRNSGERGEPAVDGSDIRQAIGGRALAGPDVHTEPAGPDGGEKPILVGPVVADEDGKPPRERRQVAKEVKRVRLAHAALADLVNGVPRERVEVRQAFNGVVRQALGPALLLRPRAEMQHEGRALVLEEDRIVGSDFGGEAAARFVELRRGRAKAEVSRGGPELLTV